MKNLVSYITIVVLLLFNQEFYGQIIEFKDIDDAFKKELVKENNALKERISNFPQIAKDINSQISSQVRQKNYTEALLLAHKLDSVLPHNSDVKEFKAKMYIRLDDSVNALNLFTEAIKLSPQNKWLYVRKAGLLSEMNKQQEALLLADELIAQYKNWSLSYFLKAMILANYNQEIEALQEFEKAINAEPKSAMIFLGRGDLYLKLGKKEQASENYKKALLIQPDYTIATEKLKSVEN